MNHGIRYKKRLAARFFVRFHMSLILAAVMASGVSVSKALLELGFTEVRVRYPLAVLGSYLVFLGLVRMWIWYVTPGKSLDVDLSDLPTPDLSADDVPRFGGFGGGSSGGGGASANWDAAVAPEAPSSGGGGSWLPDLDIDLEDGFWILLVLALLVAVILGAGAYLIYVAPELLPEAGLQLALGSGLIRVAKKQDGQGWLRGVLWSTWIPFVVVLGMTVTLAVVVHRECPQATRLLEALRCTTE